MKRLALIMLILSLATMATFASVGSAANTAECYTFTRLDPQTDAVVSVVTQPLPFTAIYPGTSGYPGGSAQVTELNISFILNAPHFPGTFYAGHVGEPLNRSSIAADISGVGSDTIENTLQPGYAKYTAASVGACSAPTMHQVNRVGMCSDIPVARVTGGFGRFVDLASGQSLVGITLTPAVFVQGFGLMCSLTEVATYGGNPANFHLSGMVGGGGTPGPGGGYPYYARN